MRKNSNFKDIKQHDDDDGDDDKKDDHYNCWFSIITVDKEC